MKNIRNWPLRNLQSNVCNLIYLENRFIAKAAIDSLARSKILISINTTASFIFSVIAIEVGLKSILLKPIVFGLVHTESVAELIANLSISHTGMNRYRDLLLHVLKEHGGINFDSYKRRNSNKILWEEIQKLQKIRNKVIHRADTVEEGSANLALDVASEILEMIFPSVMEKMGLHIHDGFRICDDWKCKPSNSPKG